MTTDFIGSLVLGGLDFFTRRYFAFEKEVLSAVSRLYLGRFKPNWLKFWPKVGLASLLDCYSMKKSGCLLKKRSFRRFPSLLGIRAQSGVFVQRCLVRQPYLGRFMPALAQILGAGSPDPSPDLLFNATKR